MTLEARTSAADREVSVIVGATLRHVREQQGLSQTGVEARTAGQVKASILGAYERGERVVSVDRLVELAEAYRLAPGVLLTMIERRVRETAGR